MIKKLLFYFILFTESLLFFLITGLLLLKFTVFNVSYIENKFEKNNYYNNLFNEIKTEMSYYTNQSGFNDDILDDIFSANDVKTSVNKFLENTYSGTKTQVNTDKLKEKFDKRIENYIKDNNYEEVDKKEITAFIDKMASIYSDEIKLMGYTDKVANKIPKIISLMDEVIIISCLVLIALIIINYKIYKRKYLGTILFTSAFLIIYMNIFIKGHIDINNLSLYSTTVTKIIKNVVNNILSISIIISIIYIVIGLVLCLKKHRHRNHN